MGGTISKNSFPVKGRTAIVTGGSQGMGLQVARQLSEKGASVVIIARNLEKLQKGNEYVKQGAIDIAAQRFHYISADLTSSSECVRVINEVEAWNLGAAPDILWCCAGTSQPTLFIDAPISQFDEQMDSNYFSSLYMAHAVLRCWLEKPKRSDSLTSTGGASPPRSDLSSRHVIFTSSVLALYTFSGYTPYSPAKAALRSLSDTLSQEMNLYAAAHPNEPVIRVHNIFPATILSEGYTQENLIKPELTKTLEGVDEGLTPAVVASKSIAALEGGQEIITTDFLSGLIKRTMLGGSVRGGILTGTLDFLLASLMAIVMVIVRLVMDRETKAWGRKFGASGSKQGAKS